ncbi:hypothetical protein RFI_33508, partial [Reticulomyxa filosa]
PGIEKYKGKLVKCNELTKIFGEIENKSAQEKEKMKVIVIGNRMTGIDVCETLCVLGVRNVVNVYRTPRQLLPVWWGDKFNIPIDQYLGRMVDIADVFPPDLRHITLPDVDLRTYGFKHAQEPGIATFYRSLDFWCKKGFIRAHHGVH